MAGRKTFVIEEKFTSADANGYLMDQAVPRFTNTTQRDGQWPSPPDGAMCVTTDTFTRWFRKSGVWQPVPTAPSSARVGISGGPIGTTVVPLGSLLVAAVPYPRSIIVSAQAYLGGIVTPPSSIFQLQVTVPGPFTWFSNAPGGATCVASPQATPLAANAAFTLTAGIIRTNGADTSTVYPGDTASFLAYLAFPA